LSDQKPFMHVYICDIVLCIVCDRLLLMKAGAVSCVTCHAACQSFTVVYSTLTSSLHSRHYVLTAMVSCLTYTDYSVVYRILWLITSNEWIIILTGYQIQILHLKSRFLPDWIFVTGKMKKKYICVPEYDGVFLSTAETLN